jgi:hypothetical protein
VIKASAFLALEASLAKRLTEGYTRLTGKLFGEVHAAIEAKNWARAETLVQSFSLTPLFEEEKNYIRMITNMTMLFGASRVTRRPGTSAIGLGDGQEQKDLMMVWLEQMLGYRAETALKAQALQLIAAEKDKDGEETIHKEESIRDDVRSFLQAIFKVGTTDGAIKAWITRRGGTPEHDPEEARMLFDATQNRTERAIASVPMVHGEATMGEQTGEYYLTARDVISDYVANGYRAINDAAIGSRRDQFLVANVHMLDEAFKAVEPTPNALHVHRGLVNMGTVPGIDPNEVEKNPGVLVGREFSEDRFISTSLRKEIATGFATSVRAPTEKMHPVILDIQVPKGAKVLSGNNSETEVILPRGSRFKVTGVQKQAGYITVHARLKKGTGVIKAEAKHQEQANRFVSPGVRWHAVQKAEGGIPGAGEPRVAQPFASFMDDAGKAYFNMVSSLHTSRVSALGFTAEAEALGVDQYQISEQLDRRTCPVCEVMDGRIFDVRDARFSLDVLTRTTDPDELTAMNPWPRQDKASLEELANMSDDEIIQNGWHVPPYHPHCRGLLVRVGNAPGIGTMDQGEQAYTATDEDFLYLQQSINQHGLDIWNSVMGMAPATVVAALRGMSTDEYLIALETGALETGIESLTFGENMVNLSLDSLAYESLAPIVQDLNITDDAITIGSIALSEQDAGLMGDAMRGIYLLADDLGVSSLNLTAGLDTGGWAWAKYGFSPTQVGWDLLRDELKLKAETLAMSEEESTAVAVLLSSPDPVAIQTLADLPIGERLLSGTEWQASLDLNDPESVERFRAYIGA